MRRRSTRLLQVRLACPDITRACDLARAFADMVRHQRGYLLLEWIRQGEQDAPKPMKGFVGFLRQGECVEPVVSLHQPQLSPVRGQPRGLDAWGTRQRARAGGVISFDTGGPEGRPSFRVWSGLLLRKPDPILATSNAVEAVDALVGLLPAHGVMSRP